MSRPDEQQLRHGIELVVEEGMLPYKAARHARLKHQVLDNWLKLYALHGEAIFEPDAEQRFELELFQIKYPQGAPSANFLKNLRQSARQKFKPLLICGLVGPAISCVLMIILGGFSDRSLADFLMSGLGCVASSFIGLIILITIIWPISVGASVANTKLRDRAYIKERRMVDKQEILGALQISSDDDNLQGGLEVVQDAGGLELLSQEDSTAGEASRQG